MKVKETVFEDRVMSFEEMMAYHIQFSKDYFGQEYRDKTRKYLEERGFLRLTGDVFKEEIPYYEARFKKEIVRDASCREHQAYYYLKMFGEDSCPYLKDDGCIDSCFMGATLHDCISSPYRKLAAKDILKNITVVEE